jgi:hypothetical protein
MGSPLPLEELLHIASGGSAAAVSNRREWELPPLAGAADTEVIAQRVARDRRCRRRPTARFALQGVCELIRK